MDYKARLTLDTSQHDDAIKKSAKQVNEYDSKVKQTGTDVRKLVAEERKAARERAIANKHYQEMARSVGDFSKGLTGGIGILGKFSGALAIGTTAAKVLSDAFMSSETNVDNWGIALEKAKGAYDVFVTTLNNGNWSNFFSNLKAAISGATELYNALDDLGTIKATNKWAIAIQRRTIAELKNKKESDPKKWTEDDEKKLKDATEKLAKLREQGVDAEMHYAETGIKTTIEKYDQFLTKEDIEYIKQQIQESGVTFLNDMKKAYEDISKTRNDVDYTYDEWGNITSKNGVFDENLLDKETQRIWRIGRLFANKEEDLSKYFSVAADAVDEQTNSINESTKSEKIRNKGTGDATDTTKKLSDEEEELQNALERFKKSIKSAQMRMSALKVWSGITNMTEIDVLESTIKIQDDEINAYYSKLQNVGKLTDEENKELNKLIDAQKGYRRKLNKLNVEEEERRTNNDYSGLSRGVSSFNDILKKSWDDYFNSIQSTELFNVWQNGTTHIDNRHGRTDSELIEDFYNEIYEYIHRIIDAQDEAQDYFNRIQTRKPFEIKSEDFIKTYGKKYEEIIKPLNEYINEYQSKNGKLPTYNELTDYFNQYLTGEIDIIDKALYGAIVRVFEKKGIVKDKIDSDFLYQMAESMLFERAVEESFRPNPDISKIVEFFTKDIDLLRDALDGDKVAQDFISDISNGFGNINIGQYIESKLKGRFGEAIKKSISEQLKEIDWKKYDLTRDQIAVWQNGTDTIRNFAGAWQSFTETMEDDDASGFEKFFAMQDAINSTIDSIFSLIDGYKRLQEVEESFVTITKQQNQLSKEAALLNAAESKTKEMVTTSASKAAIAEGTEKAVSTSSHWIEAIAAIGAVVAAITAALAMTGSFSQGGIVQKFADGGIFSGNRSVGDYNIARVNSGEMLLNGSQQAKLFQLLDGTGGFTNNQPSGEVTFRIEGSQLVGVLRNFEKKRSKIL